MDDQDLERRLRRDPTLDPPHRVGAFRDRLAGRPRHASPVRGRLTPGSGGAQVLAAALIVAAALILGRALGPELPGSLPSGRSIAPSIAPSATADVLPTTRLQTVLTEWARRAQVRRASMAVVGPRGETWTGSSAAPGEPALDPLATYRIGELSRIFLVSAVTSLDECGRGLGYSTCPAQTADPPFSIDDPLSRWIPDWPNGDAIRVRRLLDGTSGLAPVNAGMVDLLVRIRADPHADWSESAMIARARALPPSFAPGHGFAITDTGDLLLDEIIARATGRPASLWIGSSATDHFGLVSTSLAEEVPDDLVAGTLADGSQLSDLPPSALAAIGNASGDASSALDLARYANPAWATSSVHDASTIAAITDVANANSYGLGVRGLCPCRAGRPTLLGLTGHAGAWSGVVAKDTGGDWAIALLVDADLSDASLESFLDEVVATQR